LGDPVTVTTSADLDPAGTVLRIELTSGPLDNEECYVFDLDGMVSDDQLPLADSTFAIAALEADVNFDRYVDANDAAQVQLYFGMEPSEGQETVQYDVDVDGIISTTDRALVMIRIGMIAPDCGG
jgi:hypothetical protein